MDTSDTPVDLRQWISDGLAKRGWSQRQLAINAGMAPTVLNNIINNPTRMPRALTIRKLEAVLGAIDGTTDTGPVTGCLTLIDPDKIGELRPDGALRSLAEIAKSAPDRWLTAIYAPEIQTQSVPTSKATLCLIDTNLRPSSGDLVMVRSPLGDGLRYFLDPYLIKPSTGAPEFEVVGAANVAVLGRLDMSIAIHSPDA